MTSTREQRGWYMYDWANSAFYTTVITVLLGPYLTDIAKSAADSSGLVHPFGIPVDAKSLWGYLSSLSVGIQVLTLPVVGAIADYGRRKKEVLAATAYLGATSAALMFFVKGQDYLLGSALFMIANVAFGASVVIYNSFLPEIAAPDERDAVSSKGWGIGYIGGGVLLALNLVLLMKAESIGMSTGMAVRISLASSRHC
jgi:UMF1 family MFS transporter